MAERVLIVAVDAALRAAVVRTLAPAGYAVELAEGARRAREVLAADDIALTILAPEGIGSVAGDLAGELRGAGRLLVIGKPARALDRRAGPMIAGDVSLATRFDEEELLAQTRALLAAEDVVAPAEELLHFDAFTLDPSGYSVRDADGRENTLRRRSVATTTRLRCRSAGSRSATSATTLKPAWRWSTGRLCSTRTWPPLGMRAQFCGPFSAIRIRRSSTRRTPCGSARSIPGHS
jgi:DNA-binding response OmpR family regulator